MKLSRKALACAMFLFSSPVWAATYYGGFEDSVGGDYDYNDIVFQLTGATMVQSGGVFSPKPTLDNNGAPFWDHTSLDSPANHSNIGFCIYGFAADSSTCAGHPAGYSPNALYLATPSGGSVNNVTFTNDGSAASVLLTITAATDVLGWYDTTAPGTIHQINAGGGTATNVTITAASFGLVGLTNTQGGKTYYSNTALGNGGDTSGVSHFAFFAAPVPEPGSMALLAAGLLGLGFTARRKRA